jgi:four helix bundle suffix protein
MSNEFLPKGGNYKELLSYRKAEIVYDITFRFCNKFLKKNDRTVDQMIQAARSGKQNIAEGSKASKTSKETELKLTNVARASLEELLVDFEDYLRVRDLKQWNKDSKQVSFVRKLGANRESSFDDYREFVDTRSDDVVANIAICVIHQTNFLLDQQIRALQDDFVEHGGIRERMTKARLEHRRS